MWGDPNAYGYATVNVNSGARVLESDGPIGERFRILWENLKIVIANRHFWLCFASTIIAAVTQIPLLVCPDKIGLVPIIVILFGFSSFTNPLFHVL
jgi:hypothetical protein